MGIFREASGDCSVRLLDPGTFAQVCLPMTFTMLYSNNVDTVLYNSTKMF